MTPLEAGIVLLAGVGAGALNAVVGAGTLITFPTLLALGVPPILANVSNTVGLVSGSVAGAYGYRSTLTGHRRLVVRLMAASTTGGIIGATLLLALPSRTFEFIVPVLLILSAVLAAVQPRVARAVIRRRTAKAEYRDVELGPVHGGPLLLAGVAAAGVYGGYFGAAQGVILLALLGIFVAGNMNEVNGIKNILAAVANGVSAVVFISVTHIDWGIVALIAVGATVGGGLGARYGRRLPSKALRALVVVIAVAAAVWQLVR
ncbi:MAG: TSUP family transporter [Nitriliruptorales bacterium]|nr:TSUP family transporter [Nitriliruptorales bacterium]